MKKSALILMSMAAMFGLSSCDKELVPAEIVNDKANVIYASTGDNTRTALSYNKTTGEYDVVWSENDAFRLNGNDFKLTSEPGSTTGKFEGITPTVDGEYTAYYPATYNGTDWPTSQTYTVGNITGSPMTAQVEVVSGVVAGTVHFRNAGGILRLTVKNTESVSISKITVCADELESPITLDCSNGGSGVALTADGVEFNIAMPSNGNEPASYSNVSIYLTDTNGKVCCKSPKAPTLNIVRSQITKATFSVNSKDFFSYTTGSKVTIHGHEGIVVDLNHDKAADVIVATMNVGATAVKGSGCLGSYMTYDAACAAWSGWRLPTVDEIKTLCDFDYPTWGSTDAGEPGDGSNSILAWYIDDVDGIDLYLPLNDYDEDAEYNQYDKYWTGTPGSGDTYYYFAPELKYDSGEGGFTYCPVIYGDRTGVPYKEEAAKTSEFLVRLFHDLP